MAVELKLQLKESQQKYYDIIRDKYNLIEKTREHAYNEGIEMLKQVYEICKDKA